MEHDGPGDLNEFAPGSGSDDDGNDGFSDDTLKQLAAQWYNGDEDPRVESTLMAAGWEIGRDEGYDDTPGVFVVQAGDINGNSYISWAAQELEETQADPTGSWVVHNSNRVERFKTRGGAVAYAEKNGGKVASGEHYHDNIQKKGIIRESRTYKLWESAGRKICEAQLTANQIQQLFQQVEQGATSAGGNRTIVGQGKDAAMAVNQAWEQLKTKVQNSGPIKNVDAAYDQAAAKLKQATGGDQGVMQYVEKYRAFAKAHPIAQSLIYSALIAAAGISGAGVGAAAALGLLKMTDKLLQGEKFSSSAYAGAKTGALAYGAGQVGKALQGGDQAATAVGGPRLILPNDIIKQIQDGLITDEQSFFQALKGVNQNNINLIWKVLQSRAGAEGSGDIAYVIKALGGGVTNESINRYIDRSLTVYMWALNESIGNPRGGVQLTNEGIGNMFKSAVSKAGQWAQTKGHNLTTRVTADKLQSSWKKAGSPTDSDAIAKILQSAGVHPEIIKQIYTSMKIPAPAQAQTQAQAQAQTKAPGYVPPTDPAEVADMKARGFDPATGQRAKPNATSTQTKAPGYVPPTDPAEVADMKARGFDPATGRRVVEGSDDDSPVAGAITRRISSQRLDLLKQYGPALVNAAVDNIAYFVGDVEEIGSSDVSAWVAQVERMLKENPPEAFNESNELIMKEYFDYLEALRKSGVTNMFGAAPYLEREFGMDEDEAVKILKQWMVSFRKS